MQAAYLTHRACLDHDTGTVHPERPQRLHAINDRLMASGLEALMWQVEAPAASREALLRVHDAALIDRVLAPVAQGRDWLDADTVVSTGSAAAALHAAGACVHAVDLLLQKRAEFAFCAVRPPGHHAERARSMGFCLFNNIAVAAAHALASGLERVAIIDFDVHYGNGTADIFRADPRVMMCSTYQEALYPNWTGDPEARGLIDAPLRSGAGSEDYRTAVETVWGPALERFQPQMLLVSAGFDAHAGDPLADVRLREDDYRWTAAWLRERAAEHAQRRVLASLEGGYDLQSLARSTEAFLRPFVEASG